MMIIEQTFLRFTGNASKYARAFSKGRVCLLVFFSIEHLKGPFGGKKEYELLLKMHLTLTLETSLNSITQQF
jgi:hypothetical protein